MKHVMKDFNDISSETGPLVVVAILTWMLMSMFLGMFDDSVDAMLTAVAVDCNYHNMNPVYGPATFNDWQDVKSGKIGGKISKKGWVDIKETAFVQLPLR